MLVVSMPSGEAFFVFGAGNIDDNAAARDVALEGKYPLADHSVRFMFSKASMSVKEEFGSREAL